MDPKLILVLALVACGAHGGPVAPSDLLTTYPAIRPYFLDSTTLDTLLLVQVLHRHGDRNLVFDTTYPNDPHTGKHIAPKGSGRLTAIGKANAFELGRFLRARYDGYLSRVYSVAEVQAQASSVDRTIMTCQTMLAGLFPSTPEDPESMWNAKLNWQPIPIHTVPLDNDNFLVEGGKCAKYAALQKEFKESEEVKNISAKYSQFFDYLEKHSGSPINNVDDVYLLADILVVQKSHGLVLPIWAEELDFWRLANECKVLHLNHNEGPPEMQRLRVGPLFTKILANMEKRSKQADSDDEVPKIFEFSAHDHTVYSLINAFGIYDAPNIPPYASPVIVELHQLEGLNVVGDPFHVKVFFRNDTNQPAYEIEVPGCGSPCTLTKLKELKSNLIISGEDWVKECNA